MTSYTYAVPKLCPGCSATPNAFSAAKAFGEPLIVRAKRDPTHFRCPSCRARLRMVGSGLGWYWSLVHERSTTR